MDRRRFVLSWGRKIIFGLVWPYFFLLGLVFLKSGLFPRDGVSHFYFFTTNFAYSGIITTVLYFLFYAPLANLIPTYYFVRLWTSVLVLASSSLYLFDGIIFSEFRIHLNAFIIGTLKSEGLDSIFGGKLAPYILIAGMALVVFVTIWVRGEIIWRVMQRRFSNPVKNWYFALIIMSLLVSHFVWKGQSARFYGNGLTLADLFPLNYQAIFFSKDGSSDVVSNVTMNYPKKEMKCSATTDSNLILVLMEGLKNSDVSEETTPFLIHLQNHGLNFQNYYSGGGPLEDILFRTFYGIDVSYRPETKFSILNEEMKKAGYKFVNFSEYKIYKDDVVGTDWADYKNQISDEDSRHSQFLFFSLKSHGEVSADEQLREVMAKIESSKLLPESMIVVMGSDSSEKTSSPFIVITLDRSKGTYSHRTTSYDVVPTVLVDLLRCKNNVANYSFGKEARTPSQKDWEIFGNESVVKLVDYKINQTFEITHRGELKTAKPEKIVNLLEALSETTKFYR